MRPKIHKEQNVGPETCVSGGSTRGTGAYEEICELDTPGPAGFDFGGYYSFFVVFAGGGGKTGLKLSIAIFPSLWEMSWELGLWSRHPNRIKLSSIDDRNVRNVNLQLFTVNN
jgi:hypothetical protein